MTNEEREHRAGLDTAHFGNCLTPADYEEHGDDGTRIHSMPSEDWTVYECICGERFVDRTGPHSLEEHIECEARKQKLRKLMTALQWIRKCADRMASC